MWWRTPVCFLLLLALFACRPIPSRIDFTSDRRIFRGAYEAENLSMSGGAVTLQVNAVPSYINQSRYAIAGTVKLGEAPVVPFEGEVSGGDTQIYVLTEPTLPPGLEFEFSYQNELWRVVGTPTREDGYGPGRVPWAIYLGPADAFDSHGIYSAVLMPD